MRSNKGNSSATHEEEEDYDEEFSTKKEGTSNSKDAKSSDRANAIRSKHSVTEQRRRCKINERFQILRELIPHGDHKRDTASFLLEVIDYVQLLQEKVQKYEGSYQAWNAEATKLIPWVMFNIKLDSSLCLRHSHWRNQSLLAQAQSINNGSGHAVPVSGKSDEKSVSINPSVMPNAQTPLEPDVNHDAYIASLGEAQSELAEKVLAIPSPFQMQIPLPPVRTDGMFVHHPSQGLNSDSQSADCPIMSDNHRDEHIIEGGTISISSTYSQELLSTLTQALQSSGVDLSKARISIRVDLGKRANGALSDDPHFKEHDNAECNTGLAAHHREGIGREDLEQAHKRTPAFTEMPSSHLRL
ncbi:hypothetical protein V2J09_015332 [Rumex salicifolius]